MTRNRSKDGVQEMALAKTYRAEKTLDFSVLANVLPRIETLPLERAGEAFARMKSGEAKFWMVLTMTEGR